MTPPTQLTPHGETEEPAAQIAELRAANATLARRIAEQAGILSALEARVGALVDIEGNVTCRDLLVKNGDDSCTGRVFSGWREGGVMVESAHPIGDGHIAALAVDQLVPSLPSRQGA